jgi:hypothetical protein
LLSNIFKNEIMKTKMGRPPLPKGQSKNFQVGVRLNATDNKSIEKAIANSGGNQTKAEWVRDMAKFIASDGVICQKFTVGQLDGKTVWFKIRMQNGEPIEGNGKIMALQRGDGTLKIQIESRYIYDNPQSSYRFTTPQGAVPWIKKLPASSEYDFELVDPSLQT